MNLMGYLITLVNLQSFDKHAGPVQDIAVKVASIETLVNDLKTAGVNLDGFRSTGYYRTGNVGQYLSHNLRDYIYKGEGDPKNEGVVLTLIFKDKLGDHPSADDETLTYFLHKNVGDEDTERVKTYLDGRNYG
ncbi:hypothetical protein ABMA28_000826 [Loxostege sticticalis]|uniref:Uncharacterized protein n=1 Tax=Loxostege sticticalis TaxID=481309 RepID=A0ABD0T7R8_LOXSC